MQSYKKTGDSISFLHNVLYMFPVVFFVNCVKFPLMTKRTFKPEIVLPLHILLWISLLCMFWLFWARYYWEAFPIMIFNIVLLHLIIMTDYSITAEGLLIIRNGVLSKQQIDINAIMIIKRECRFPKVPIFRVDHLILMGDSFSIHVLPELREPFIAELLSRNPNIKII